MSFQFASVVKAIICIFKNRFQGNRNPQASLKKILVKNYLLRVSIGFLNSDNLYQSSWAQNIAPSLSMSVVSGEGYLVAICNLSEKKSKREIIEKGFCKAP